VILRDLPDALKLLRVRARDRPDGIFDICFSNAVIEHVGTLYDQIARTNEVRGAGVSARWNYRGVPQ
jgi:hypothetical protein